MIGGWAKLDQPAVDNLCLIIAGFERNKDEQAHTLLTLYRLTRNDGRIYIGSPTLALEAGVTRRKARYLIERLEKDGWLVNEGTKKDRSGEYTVRRWSWIEAEGVANNLDLMAKGGGHTIGHPYGQYPRVNGQGGGQYPRVNGQHQTLQKEESKRGDAKASHAQEIEEEDDGWRPRPAVHTREWLESNCQ